MVAIVVRKLYVWQTLLPIRTIFKSTILEHILQDLVHSLCLAIHLRMVSSVVIQSSLDCLMETLPELGHILRPSIRHYAPRGSMKPKNVIHIEIYELLSSVVIPHSYEVSYLGQSINNYLDQVMAIRGWR